MSFARRFRLQVVGLLLAGVLFGGAPSIAQQSMTSGLGATTEEEAAFKELQANHLISARTKAEKGLEKNPDGILGLYVLGQVMRESEGDLGQAMQLLGRSRELYEKRFGAIAPASAPWQFHRELLYAVQGLAGEMDEPEFQIEIIHYHNALYDPDFLGEEAWALLKKREFKEARELAKKAIGSSEPWQKRLGRNALCAIEGEAQEREAAVKACQDALDATRKQDKDDAAKKPEERLASSFAVDAYNTSSALLTMLRFQEAEALLREATTHREFTIANPWRSLVDLYLDEGKGAEAASALRDMQSWRQRNPASLRDQDRALTDGTVALFLLAAGEAEVGFKLVHRAIEMPDRHGLTSSNPEATIGAHALLARTMLRMRAERIREEASVHGTFPRLKRELDALTERMRAWSEEERAKSALVDGRVLVSSFRVRLGGGLYPLPPWMIGEVIEVVGTGVAKATLKRARDEEKVPKFAAYYDAVEGEIAWRNGNESEAIRLGEGALKALPKEEVLLGARVRAYMAEAYRKSRDSAKALSRYEEVMTTDPGLIRRLGISLPVRLIVSSGEPVSDRALTLLKRSPRLRPVDGDGLPLTFTRAGDRTKLCLETNGKVQIACVELERWKNIGPKKNEKETDSDLAARTIDEFHKRAFAGKFGLSPDELKLFDGSQSLAQRAQRDAVKKAVE